MRSVYLDYNATTPIDPEVAAAMQPFLGEYFGNPSSSHYYGVQTRKAVEEARKHVANLLHAHPDEIIFTSGGTESNNYAIKGIALTRRNRGNHIITTAIEHPAVVEVCRYLEKQGFRITFLPVDADGLVNPVDLQKAITPQTILVSVMHANNEVGTIQPISELSAIAHSHKVAFHCDAAQSVGKIPVHVDEMGIDLLSVAGHKLYAPKGIGALYIKRGITLEKLIHGADHEQNLRAGTENILEIAGLGKACEIAARDLEKNMDHMRKMRDLLQHGLQESGLDFRLNGHEEKRLPNTLSLSFKGVEANTALSELDDVAASAGAACHSDQVDVSAVLEAMKVPIEYAMGTIRLSTGRTTTEEDIQFAVKRMTEVISRFQNVEDEAPSQMIATSEIKLTHFTHGMGCACKIEPDVLEKVLRKLPQPIHENILVGTSTADDAAVYKISDDQAVVVTLDFFTPIADDPYTFGQIAAANALSDLYAMGATPLFGLNIVAFPIKRLPLEVLEAVLKGAQSKADEAGIFIIGGHSIEDPELKYGMVAVGVVHPDKIWRNAGIKPGDSLILTKPIGTGVLSTALKRGLLDSAQEEKLYENMSTLNAEAYSVLKEYPVSACTDVTGFGLLGHLTEMSVHSKMDVEIVANDVPVMENVMELIAANVVPGGTRANLNHVEHLVHWDLALPQKLLLCDAQTSGGLLASLPSGQAQDAMEKLQEKGLNARIIGKALQEGSGKIFVR